MFLLDVMYYGKAYPTSAEQKERVLRCLSDLNFIGSLGTDGTFSRGEHNNEKSMDWSTTRIEKVQNLSVFSLLNSWYIGQPVFMQNIAKKFLESMLKK